MKSMLCLLLAFSVAAMAAPFSVTPTFSGGVLNLPVVTYAPEQAAKVAIKMDFETHRFEIVHFESFDCALKTTQFSPYPTAWNYNPCDFR